MFVLPCAFADEAEQVATNLFLIGIATDAVGRCGVVHINHQTMQFHGLLYMSTK